MAAKAERQHGVVSRRQLLDLGLSSAEIEGRLKRGTLHRLHRGVYAVGHRLLTTDGKWMASVLAAGPDAVLSHRSAAQLWRISLRAPIDPEVTRSDGFRGRPGIRIHRIGLSVDEVTVVDGIPVTSVFRTIFDLAAVASEREVERAFHEAEVRQLTDRVSLPMLLERHPGHRGAAGLRRLLASREPTGIVESKLEEHFLAFLDARGFPRPRLNATLSLRGRLLRPDCMWLRERLIVELDGHRVHGTGRAFERDRKRDRELLAEGWRSTRVTWRQLRDEPEAIAADLRQALELPSRNPHPPGK